MNAKLEKKFRHTMDEKYPLALRNHDFLGNLGPINLEKPWFPKEVTSICPRNHHLSRTWLHFARGTIIPQGTQAHFLWGTIVSIGTWAHFPFEFGSICLGKPWFLGGTWADLHRVTQPSRMKIIHEKIIHDKLNLKQGSPAFLT